MKQWLLVIVVAFALPVYGQKEGPQSAADQNHSNQTGNSVGSVVQQQNSHTKDDRTNGHTDGYLGRLFSPENLPNIGLFIAGIIGIFIAICTLKVIDKQTQALIDAERARVYVKAFKKLTGGGHATFTIKAKNYGRVPARITMYTYTEVALQDPDRELKIPPQYGGSLLTSEKFVESGDRLGIMVFDPFSTINKQRHYGIPNAKMVIFWKLEYFDGISEDKREARFAYVHLKPISQIGGYVTRCGPAEYNKSN
jgi:hypothetical protein